MRLQKISSSKNKLILVSLIFILPILYAINFVWTDNNRTINFEATALTTLERADGDERRIMELEMLIAQYRELFAMRSEAIRGLDSGQQREVENYMRNTINAIRSGNLGWYFSDISLSVSVNQHTLLLEIFQHITERVESDKVSANLLLEEVVRLRGRWWVFR